MNSFSFPIVSDEKGQPDWRGKVSKVLFRLWMGLLCFFPNPSSGQLPSDELVRVSAFADSKCVRPGESAWILVEVEVKPGWHAYWKTAGQTGYPTTIEWDAPEGVSLGPLFFPAPRYYEFQGLGSYVHEGSFRLLSRLSLKEDLEPGQSLSMIGRFSTLVCDETNCIPFRSDFSLDLAIGETTQPEQSLSRKFEQAQSSLPSAIPKGTTASISVDGAFVDLSIQNEVLGKLALSEFYFFPEGDFFEHGAGQTFSLEANSSALGLRLRRNPETPHPESLRGVLTHPGLDPSWSLDLGIRRLVYGEGQGASWASHPSDVRHDQQTLWYLLAFVLFGLAAWIFGKSNQPHHGESAKKGIRLLSLVVLGAGIWLGYPSKPKANDGIRWQSWSPELEKSLRDQGKAVYVDFTAKWCLSCQVNKRVFLSEAVIARFKDKQIVPLLADWTQRGPAILEALQANGREGVPLNLYYPSHADGIVMPEILTEEIVLKVLETNRPYLVAQVDGFASILGFALLGGIILNLMPCVFPVIGLKIMSFAKQAGEDKKSVKRHGLVFTFGVLFSFWILSGLLLFLRDSLETGLGWGFQLQEPIFVFGLAVFLFVFALSLSGVLDIGGSLTGMGSHLTRAEGYVGTFFSGVLATVVATPCMAPFLGAAVGAALTMNWLHAFMVFSFVALGLSLPYLILSVFPAWIAKLPKPGPWMDTFKQFMAFPLYATVAWLLWTLQSLL